MVYSNRNLFFSVIVCRSTTDLLLIYYRSTIDRLRSVPPRCEGNKPCNYHAKSLPPLLDTIPPIGGSIGSKIAHNQFSEA